MIDDDATQQGAEQETNLQPAWKNRAAAMEEVARTSNAMRAAEFEPAETEEDQPSKQAEEKQAQPSQDAAEDQPEAKASEPVEPKRRTIIVDGQRIEVDEDKILEAGIKTLQKESAADKRLQEATALLKRAKQGYAQQEQEQEPEESQRNSYIDPDALYQAVDRMTEQKVYASEARRAATAFKSEFPEIASDPYLMKLAADLEEQRLTHSLSVGEPLGDPGDAYRKHGQEIKKWLAKQSSALPAADSSTEKLERKRQITVVPSANVRATPTTQANRELTVQEQIEQIRLARKGRPILNQRSH